MTCPDCAALRREVEEWREGLASALRAVWVDCTAQADDALYGVRLAVMQANHAAHQRAQEAARVDQSGAASGVPTELHPPCTGSSGGTGAAFVLTTGLPEERPTLGQVEMWLHTQADHYESAYAAVLLAEIARLRVYEAKGNEIDAMMHDSLRRAP